MAETKVTENEQSNPYKCRVFRETSTQSIGAGAFTKIEFNGEDYDVNSNFDSTTNYEYTVDVDGFYQINSAVGVDMTSQDEALIAIYVNGVDVARGFRALSDAGGLVTPCISDILNLTAGDTVQIHVFAGTAGIIQANLTDTKRTFLSIHLLSL